MVQGKEGNDARNSINTLEVLFLARCTTACCTSPNCAKMLVMSLSRSSSGIPPTNNRFSGIRGASSSDESLLEESKMVRGDFEAFLDLFCLCLRPEALT